MLNSSYARAQVKAENFAGLNPNPAHPSPAQAYKSTRLRLGDARRELHELLRK